MAAAGFCMLLGSSCLAKARVRFKTAFVVVVKIGLVVKPSRLRETGTEGLSGFVCRALRKYRERRQSKVYGGEQVLGNDVEQS